MSFYSYLETVEIFRVTYWRCNLLLQELDSLITLMTLRFWQN